MDTSKNHGINYLYPMTKDLVSVIIPAYNREGTILRAVQSVLEQTYPDLEVIVVDDCSTDGTVEKLKSIEDDRLTVIELERNEGACHARNVGVSHARGEWIAFQDSDDEWMRNKLSRQVTFMNKGNYDFSFCQGRLYLPNGRVVESPSESYHTLADRDWYNVLMTDFPVSTQKFICRRHVMVKYGFDESLCKSQDKDFAIMVAKTFHVGYQAEPLVNIYSSPDSITFSGNKKKKYDSILRIMMKHREELKRNPKGQAFFCADLGDYSYEFDKKLALSWYKKSLDAIFSKKVLAKYILTYVGLRKLF